MSLRQYQKNSVEAVYRHLAERDDNPVVVIPTGGGKTHVIAQICRDVVSQWGGRIIILAHVKELLEQTIGKIKLVAPDLKDKIGIHSAGLGRRDLEHQIIVAGIHSAYQRAEDFGKFDIAIVDEAHMIPMSGDGMYRTFIEEAKTENPLLRVIGLTATPYRMTTGMICTPENIWGHICFEVGVRNLINDGYLCQLISKGSKDKIDTSDLHLRGGEFVPDEVESLMNQTGRVESSCDEIIERTADRKSCLIFASGVKHANHVADILRERTDAAVSAVFGDTPAEDRARIITQFRAGQIKYLVNVSVLTTGFDAPNVDCVVLLRPTMSPGLYYQMAGRGFRLCEGKKDCLILDFGGNVRRHGPIDKIQSRGKRNASTNASKEGGNELVRECPECLGLIDISNAICPQCGYEFPREEKRNHEREADTANILSQVEEHDVREIAYYVHVKRGAPSDAPTTMKVEYRIGFQTYQSEWVCFEHTGYAREKAIAWWRARSNLPVPNTTEEAVYYAKAGALSNTLAIMVKPGSGKEYDKIINYKLSEKPNYREPGWDDIDEESFTNTEKNYDDDIPF